MTGDSFVQDQLPMKRLNLIIVFFIILSCEQKPGHPDVKQIASDYFNTYAERTDWDKFLSYYDGDLQFEDIISQQKLSGIQQFREFYNWPDTGYRKHPDYPRALELDKLIINDKAAIGKGRFLPFYWYGKMWDMTQEGEFIIWLEFNEEGKITRQIDWIEYPGEILEAIGKGMQSADQ